MDRAPRTSRTDPIEVFWVDEEALGTAGRLGLTFAPGKRGRGLVSGSLWQRKLGVDLDELRRVHRVDLLVSLMESFEYDDLEIPDLFEQARARGMRVLHLPIVDMQAPDPGQERDVLALIGAIRAALQAGENVVVHCRGGRGRSGTIAALTVASYGHAPGAAIDIVRQAQPQAVESPLQRAYVLRLGAELADGGPAGPPSGGPVRDGPVRDGPVRGGSRRRDPRRGGPQRGGA